MKFDLWLSDKTHYLSDQRETKIVEECKEKDQEERKETCPHEWDEWSCERERCVTFSLWFQVLI
jgi:hypothetical protein